MPEMTFTIPDSSPCFYCRVDMPMTETVCAACNEEVPDRFTEVEMYSDFRKSYILDVRHGGLVLGRHDMSDDIPLFSCPVEGIFQLSGMMMGWEYILNSAAYAKHKDRLEEINSDTDVPVYNPNLQIEITDATRIYNTNGVHGELHLLIDSAQFVINRLATQKHYKELEELNNSVALPRP